MRHRLIIDPVVAANGACWQRQVVVTTYPPTRPADIDTLLSAPDQEFSGESRTPPQDQTLHPRRPA